MRVRVVLQTMVLVIGLCGCTPDPFKNPGDWSMTGASRKNAAVQAAVPSQLIFGQPADNANGVAASAAIDKALGGAAGTAAGLETPPPITALSITGS
jgi:hypothetical protein